MFDATAFFNELEKIAFGWDDMNRVLRLSRAKTMRLPSRHLPVGPMALPKAMLPAQRQAITAAVGSGQIPEAVGKQGLKTVEQLGGKALMPKGGGSRFLEQAGMPKGMLVGKERKALDTLFRGHELDELALGARKFDPAYATKATHVSPDVVLRERNRLLTMPQEVRPAVTRAMTPLREPLEAPVLERATRTVSGKGLEYGAGPRLSRHARKRISKRMKEITALPETPDVSEMIRKMQAGG